MKTLYLASKSPRRKDLLRQAGIPFELLPLREHPPERRDVDETPLRDELPLEYVVRIAKLKAAAALRIMQVRRLTPRLILAADTTVVLDGRILGKPDDPAGAAEMLKSLSGRTHHVYTAVAVATVGETESAVSKSEVTFRTLDAAEIRQYVQSGEPLDKAGSYAVQGRAALFISHLAGSYSGVMGLPLFETGELLRNAQTRLP